MLDYNRRVAVSLRALTPGWAEAGARLIDVVIAPHALLEAQGRLRLNTNYYITKQALPWAVCSPECTLETEKQRQRDLEDEVVGSWVGPDMRCIACSVLCVMAHGLKCSIVRQVTVPW